MEPRVDHLDQLRLFLAIVDAGSFAAGGRKFARSPSSATRIIAELEQRLGTRLLQRTTRKLSLTDSGARLVEQARRLLGDFDEAIRYAVGEGGRLRGPIHLSAPISFGNRHVAPVVRDFLDAHPEITVRMTLEDRLVDLVEERIDVAMRIGHLENSSLVCKRVGMLRRVVVASPDYLRRHGTPRTPEQLARHAAVSFVNHANPAAWIFQGRDRKPRKVGVPSRLEVNRAEAAILLARQGMGLTRALSYQVADDIARGSLVRLLKAYEPAPIPIHLVYPSARLLAPRIRAFLDFAARRISSLAFNTT